MLKLIVALLLLPIHIVLFFLRIVVFYRGGSALGDHFVLTSVIPELKKQKRTIIVISTFPEFFYNNPHILATINLNKIPEIIKKILFVCFSRSSYDTLVYFMVQQKNDQGYAEYMRNSQSKEHLREVHIRHTKWLELVKDKPLTNHIYFTLKEKKEFEKYELPKTFGLVHAQAKTTYAPIKDWGIDSMQQVVNTTNLQWVQVTVGKEEQLDDVVAFKNIPLRAFLFIASKASVILCNEGLYTHVSAAFNVPCVTVFSGLTPTNLSAYTNVYPITKKMPCAACWQLGSGCPLYKEARCIKNIQPQTVVAKINEVLA